MTKFMQAEGCTTYFTSSTTNTHIPGQCHLHHLSEKTCFSIFVWFRSTPNVHIVASFTRPRNSTAMIGRSYCAVFLIGEKMQLCTRPSPHSTPSKLLRRFIPCINMIANFSQSQENISASDYAFFLVWGSSSSILPVSLQARLRLRIT